MLPFWNIGPDPFQGGPLHRDLFLQLPSFSELLPFPQKNGRNRKPGIRIQFDFNPARILDRLNLRRCRFFPHPAAKRARVQTRKRKGRSNFLIEIHPFHASLYHVFKTRRKNRPPAGDRLRFKGYTARESCSFPKPSSSRTSSQITIRAFLNPLKVVAEADV